MKKLLDYATGMFIFPLSFRQLDLRYGYKVQNKTEVELEIPVSFRLRIPVKPATQSGESGHPVGAKRRWGFHDVSGGRFESM